MKRAEKEKRGFTLAELLVVVAIIGVLVAISIPIFTTQLEKARRSVDLYNARAVESVLVNAINDGSVQIPPGTNTNAAYGIWVTIKREGNENWPQNYNQSGNVFYGANPGIIINGHNTENWNINNTYLQNIVKANGIDVDNLKVNCRKSDSKNGTAGTGSSSKLDIDTIIQQRNLFCSQKSTAVLQKESQARTSMIQLRTASEN